MQPYIHHGGIDLVTVWLVLGQRESTDDGLAVREYGIGGSEVSIVSLHSLVTNLILRLIRVLCVCWNTQQRQY